MAIYFLVLTVFVRWIPSTHHAQMMGLFACGTSYDATKKGYVEVGWELFHLWFLLKSAKRRSEFCVVFYFQTCGCKLKFGLVAVAFLVRELIALEHLRENWIGKEWFVGMFLIVVYFLSIKRSLEVRMCVWHVERSSSLFIIMSSSADMGILEILVKSRKLKIRQKWRKVHVIWIVNNEFGLGVVKSIVQITSDGHCIIMISPHSQVFNGKACFLWNLPSCGLYT